MRKQFRGNRRPGRAALALSLILGAFALAGCGDDSGDEHGGHMHGPDTDCGLMENCTDTVTLEEGLEVEGEEGVFSAKIVSHNELSITDNEWTIEVTDADGARVEDATVTVNTHSVDCGHPGPSPDADVTANAAGNYEVAPDNGHGGPWDTVLSIEAGGESDTVNVHLCIPGMEHEGGAAGGAGHDMHGSE